MRKNTKREEGTLKDGWSTNDEMRFLNRLGSHASYRKLTPNELLKGYERGINRRVRWGGLDEITIRAFLLDRIVR